MFGFFKKKGAVAAEEAEKPGEVRKYYVVQDTEAARHLGVGSWLGKEIVVSGVKNFPQSFAYNPYLELLLKRDMPGVDKSSTSQPKYRWYNVDELGVMRLHTIQVKKKRR